MGIFSFTVPSPQFGTSTESCEEQNPVKCPTWTVSVSVYSHTVSDVSLWFGFCVVFNWSQNCARTEGLPQPPWEPPAGCPQPTSQADLVLKIRNNHEEEDQSLNSILNVIFCSEGNFLILVVTTSVWWLPGQNQNLRVKPLWTNNLCPCFLQKTHQVTMSLLLGWTLFNIQVAEQSKIITVLMIQLRKVIPAHFTAKNSGAFLYSWPSFIAFIVISSEDYLISPECQQHIDLLLKLNNSLNNALGRHFSQPVIFRQLGERGASRKRKSMNVFLNRF